MRELHRGIGNTGACLGPLDLLHIAVKDVASSERLARARSVPRCVTGRQRARRVFVFAPPRIVSYCLVLIMSHLRTQEREGTR